MLQQVNFAKFSQIWLYAGNSEYPVVLLLKRSDNPPGADNQQGRFEFTLESGWTVFSY